MCLHVRNARTLCCDLQMYRRQDEEGDLSGSEGEESRHQDHDYKYEDEDEDKDEDETPRPPPPVPTPAPDLARPPRLKQTWGSFPHRKRGGVVDGGRYVGTNDGTNTALRRNEFSPSFLEPSKLQEPSLCSTLVEQTTLERRMREVSRVQV